MCKQKIKIFFPKMAAFISNSFVFISYVISSNVTFKIRAIYNAESYY